MIVSCFFIDKAHVFAVENDFEKASFLSLWFTINVCKNPTEFLQK